VVACGKLLQVLNAQSAGYDAAIIYSLTSEHLVVMKGSDGKLLSVLLQSGVNTVL